MPFPKFSCETPHNVSVFVTNRENTKVDPTLLRSYFHFTRIFNILTDGTMVVYLDQPSSISPIVLNNDQIVVFNDSLVEK
jgi:hypothetical protein